MRWRFIAAIMGVTLVVLATICLPLAWYLHDSAHAQTVNELEKNAFAIAGRSSAMLWSPDAGNIAYASGLADAYSRESGAKVVVTDTSGTALVVTETDQGQVGTSFLNRPEVVQALAGQVAVGERESATAGTELMFVAVPVLSGEQVLGAVRLSYPESVVEARILSQLSLLWIVAGSALVAAGLGGVVLAGSVTRPLKRLTETAEAVAAGDLTRRSDPDRGAPEIRALATAYNRMSDRLAELLDEQRRFAADASHQLRTPLTSLRLRLESAHALLASEPERAAERIEAAVGEVDRMTDLTEALLLLSRGELDDGWMVETDVAAVVDGLRDTWAPLAEERGVHLRTSVQVGTSAWCMDGALEQVLGNLIENSIRACAGGGTIEVTTETRGDRVDVTVTDDGVGMTEEQLDRAFERFWRGDATTAGAGIGLAIVKRLVEASHGTIELRRREPRGVSAHIQLSRVRAGRSS